MDEPRDQTDPANGFPEPDTAALALWRQLMVAALRTGVAYEDARDLASQALLKGMQSFDGTRGRFAPFCHTVHRNLLKNHWRDRKPTVEFDPEDDPREAPDTPHDRFVSEEMRAMMRDVADRILESLDPGEAAFFLTLSEVCDETGSALVSEAARRLGLKPAAGWDVFRRIQRRARGIAGDLDFIPGSTPGARPAPSASAPDEDFQPLRDSYGDPPDGAQAEAFPTLDACAAEYRPRRQADPALLFLAACAQAGFDRFAAGLSGEQRGRLAAFLS